VDKILRGAKPADLPVEQADQVRSRHHLVAAKALGLTVPPTLLGPRRRGDRVKRRAFISLLAARLSRGARGARAAAGDEFSPVWDETTVPISHRHSGVA